jgi:sulfide:quinone oxidoreductase
VADSSSSTFRVVIAGGGVAGLEAVLALRDLLGGGVDVTIVAPEREFVYRPMAVAEPFARGHPQRHRLAEIAADLGARLVQDRLERVDDQARTAVTAGDETLEYDALVVAIGAGAEPVYRRALTWTPESDAEIYGGLLSDLEEGYSKRVAFVVPEGVYWPLPAYELALMTAWQAQGMGQADVEIAVYTHEDAPLEIFGSAASEAVANDLGEAGIEVRTGVRVAESDSRLTVEPGGDDLGDRRVVSLPRAVGQPLEGLPRDERGFVPSDEYGQVEGTDAVWVAGDAAAYPIKQGGLAAQQADVVARAIAQRAGAGVEPEPFHPVLRGVLLTGRGQAWMRHDAADESAPGAAARRALFWPPTKIAGRYLSPYLARLAGTEPAAGEEPSGELVELDLGR